MTLTKAIEHTGNVTSPASRNLLTRFMRA